jgi:hypothetical protein
MLHNVLYHSVLGPVSRKKFPRKQPHFSLHANGGFVARTAKPYRIGRQASHIRDVESNDAHGPAGLAGIFLRPVMPGANVRPKACIDGYFARLNAITAQLEPAAEIHWS